MSNPFRQTHPPSQLQTRPIRATLAPPAMPSTVRVTVHPSESQPGKRRNAKRPVREGPSLACDARMFTRAPSLSRICSPSESQTRPIRAISESDVLPCGSWEKYPPSHRDFPSESRELGHGTPPLLGAGWPPTHREWSSPSESRLLRPCPSRACSVPVRVTLPLSESLLRRPSYPSFHLRQSLPSESLFIPLFIRVTARKRKHARAAAAGVCVTWGPGEP